jgi:hypothetical protein
MKEEQSDFPTQGMVQFSQNDHPGPNQSLKLKRLDLSLSLQDIFQSPSPI